MPGYKRNGDLNYKCLWLMAWKVSCSGTQHPGWAQRLLRAIADAATQGHLREGHLREGHLPYADAHATGGVLWYRQWPWWGFQTEFCPQIDFLYEAPPVRTDPCIYTINRLS